MAEDTLIYTRVDGKVVRCGDVGKSKVIPLPEGATEDDLEYNFFYVTDPPTVTIVPPEEETEISNIQVEPEAPSEIKNGAAVIFGTGDLL